jgi:ureidoacrylate peracid hydrolase
MSLRGVKPGEPRADLFRETIIWDIVPERTALLVIDMQNAFVNEKGLFYVPAAKEALATINKIVKSCREHGILVVWVVRAPYRKDGLDVAQEKDFFHDLVGNPAGYSEGGWGLDLHPELDARKEDLIVPKTRYSAFIAGSSNLDRILRYQDRDTVIIAGVATNVCCGTTARDAMMLDYKVIFVSDANAAFGEVTPGGYGPGMVHEAELITLRSCFAMVCTTQELTEILDKLSRKASR